MSLLCEEKFGNLTAQSNATFIHFGKKNKANSPTFFRENKNLITLLFAQQCKKEMCIINDQENQLPGFQFLSSKMAKWPKRRSLIIMLICLDQKKSLVLLDFLMCGAFLYVVLPFHPKHPLYPKLWPRVRLFISFFSPLFFLPEPTQPVFPSQSQALAHYKGTKHAKKLKALDAPKSKLKGAAMAKDAAIHESAKGLSSAAATTTPLPPPLLPNGTDRKGLCASSLWVRYSQEPTNTPSCVSSHHVPSLRTRIIHSADRISWLLARVARRSDIESLALQEVSHPASQPVNTNTDSL